MDIVAYTCGVTRLDLNVVRLSSSESSIRTKANWFVETASCKGLVAGLHENGEPYELVPDKDLETLYELLDEVSHAAEWKWILVVEKEVGLSFISLPLH